MAVHLNAIPRKTAPTVFQMNCSHDHPLSRTGMPYFAGAHRPAATTAPDAHPGHGSLTFSAVHFRPQSRHLMVVLYLRLCRPDPKIADITRLTIFTLSFLDNTRHTGNIVQSNANIAVKARKSDVPASAGPFLYPHFRYGSAKSLFSNSSKAISTPSVVSNRLRTKPSFSF